ncbi:MAG: hypothetical protein HYV16_03530 [Gammaproteobacteria bacterium]|nr:hypothetical protein [Gammaproteobacteria bacterium]
MAPLFPAVCIGSLLSTAALADEGLWVYTKGADTLPEGRVEAKLSSISRLDKNSGDYAFHDIRPEIEYGLTDSLTISAEALVFHHDYAVDDPELNPMFETQGGEGERFKDTQFGGYELSMKYNLLSTYKDALGFSVGLGYEKREKYRLDGADIDQDSFVLAFYTQKNFLDDTLMLAVTPKIEFERRKSPGVLEEEIALDFSAGIAYRFAPQWFVGLDFRHQSDYLNPQEEGEFNPELDRSSFDLSDFRVGSRHQYGNYFGPTLHYAAKEWWVTAGVLWQVRGGGSKFSFSRDGRNWDEHERMHVGLSFAYEI